MVMLDAKDQAKNAVALIGTGQSGELNIDYIEACLKTMRPGRVYELMCHPGYYDAGEISDRRLTRYHAWENELRLLTSPSFKRLLQNYNVRLISYNNLTNGWRTELTKAQN
jgi:predicted glycoside hydrolase/deacetylase ChbG (UPF0249 family)